MCGRICGPVGFALLTDLVLLLDSRARMRLRSLVQHLKRQLDLGQISSLSRALFDPWFDRGPAVVGWDIWNQCLVKQHVVPS